MSSYDLQTEMTGGYCARLSKGSRCISEVCQTKSHSLPLGLLG